jgi:hypothetical protein
MLFRRRVHLDVDRLATLDSEDALQTNDRRKSARYLLAICIA